MLSNRKTMKTAPKTHILIVLAGLTLLSSAAAQTNGPLPIIWQATYGAGKNGSGGSGLPGAFVQTSDGGYLLAGPANGLTNELRTAPICGDNDYWVIKIDAQGRRQWDRSYGGRGPDIAFDVLLTSDGGFLVLGMSFSEAGCLKTAPQRGGEGYGNGYAVRCDASGDLLWDQSYLIAPLAASYLDDIQETSDGGYLCGGYGVLHQYSGLFYYCVMKLDSEGQQLWTKTIGPDPEKDSFQESLRIRETPDGGFIMAGASNSSPSGDKTSPYFGGFIESAPFLGSDFWVVRVDAQQNKMWDKSYGGSGTEFPYDIRPAADGGFLIVGNSSSLPVTDPAKGTKTSPRYGGQDFWIVRIDGQGNQLWDKSYGGSRNDLCTWAEPMPDGGWLLAGYSNSSPDGSKTSPLFGGSDFWIVRIDEQGTQLWDQSFGGSGIDGWDVGKMAEGAGVARIKRSAEGGFLLTGISYSLASGLKTAQRIGESDIWVLKLGPEPPSLRGEVTNEGQFKLRLIGPPEFKYLIQGSADLVTWTDLVTLTNPTGKAYWTDPDEVAPRYYRAMRK